MGLIIGLRLDAGPWDNVLLYLMAEASANTIKSGLCCPRPTFCWQFAKFADIIP
jgi:hypothetical protein